MSDYPCQKFGGALTYYSEVHHGVMSSRGLLQEFLPMQLFIGLTFNQSFLQFKKIDSFRKRFDEKYNRSHLLQMTLMPPFRLDDVSSQGLNHFLDDLAEDLEDHLGLLEEPIEVDFNGFDFLGGRKGVLFLKPSIPVDLFFCQETLHESIKDFGGIFNKHKNLGRSFANDLQTFLPIGRFTDMELLSQAVDKARLEFASPFKLTARDLTVFEKAPGQWIPRKILFSFPKQPQEFTSGESDFSLIKSPVNL